MRYLRTLGLAACAALALTASIGTGAASATTFAIGETVKNSSIEIVGTLTAGSSLILKDEFGNTTDTCTKSEFKEKTEAPYTAEKVGGKASTLTYEDCTHTTKVDANGTTDYLWLPITDSATVYSTGAEVTVQSTFFGATALCKTGTGTHIGTFTGVWWGWPKMDYNARMNCGILGTANWTGQYTITSPEGLRAVK
ncbi:MAG: hypothetical protein QOF06_2113 [Solirubrobacterales bacterium]|jgi:hypothetical protein|nr:hypothetical protein [Solirubrobacterales bacterium]